MTGDDSVSITGQRTAEYVWEAGRHDRGGGEKSNNGQEDGVD